MISTQRRWAICLAVGLGSVIVAASAFAAERPGAAKLLPESTLALVRVADSKELVKRFNETAMGRIGQDDQVRPLIGQLYGSVSQAFGQIEDEVGLPLDKILTLPQGEMYFAVTAPAAGPPALLVMIEAGDQMPSLNKLIAKGEDLAAREGREKTTEVLGEVKLSTIKFGDGSREQVIYFDKDGVFVVATDLDLVKFVLKSWNGQLKADDKTLSDDRKFTTVMNRCLGAKDDPPQLAWYVDPIRLAKVASRGNTGAQTAIALLPAIGLDGLQAIGGSVTMATGEFDSVSHIHVMLDEPRSGVLEAIAITSGDTTPEPWVPADAASYVTINFDAEKSYDAIAKVYNSIAGDNALQNELKRRVSDRLEVEFQKDLLGATAGRFTMMSWIEKPIQLGSQATVIGVKLKDPKAFRETFDKLTEKYKDNLEKSAYGATPYWKLKVAAPQAAVDVERTGREVRVAVRPPQPSFAILEDYLLITDRPTALEHLIITASDSSKSLAKDLEFKLIMSKVKRQPGGETPGMISFNRPEEGMRLLYELANGEQAKTFLANRSERNDFIKNVDQAMKDNPLPPFAVISKYLAPGGGLLTSDETGIHYAAFQLRRK
jgi:hypothetical protein